MTYTLSLRKTVACVLLFVSCDAKIILQKCR